MTEQPDATETLRLEILAGREEPEADLRQHYAPGAFGCHEALHMASFLMQAVDGDLMVHPAIVVNPDWFRLANAAHQALFDLYQAIGAVHLGTTQGAPEAD